MATCAVQKVASRSSGAADENVRFAPGEIAFAIEQGDPDPHGVLASSRVRFGDDTLVLYALDRPVASEAAAPLDAAERRELATLRSPLKRTRYIASRTLLRNALTHYVGGGTAVADWRFGRHPGGKPRLAGRSADLEFSLSYCGTNPLVAVGRRPLGLDIEAAAPSLYPSDLDPYLSPAERAATRGLSSDARRDHLIRLWTLKEAFLKLRGTGLADDPSAVEFTLDGPPPQSGRARCFHASPDYRAAAWTGTLAGSEILISLAT